MDPSPVLVMPRVKKRAQLWSLCEKTLQMFCWQNVSANRMNAWLYVC